MPEMGVEGEALVTGIDRCPEIEMGLGRVVTGAFVHSTGELYELRCVGEEDIVRLTGGHPLWSVDSQKWVSATELTENSVLLGIRRQLKHEELVRIDGKRPVHNLEVGQDHVFRVGNTGILVHNDSCDYCQKNKFKYQEKAPKGYSSWTDYVVRKCGGSTRGVSNPHGHHIVMKGDRFPENAKARQLLCKYKIDPYIGCENLVIARNHCHSKQYAEYVLAQLEAADKNGSRSKILAALSRSARWHSRCNQSGDVNPITDE